MLAAGLDMKVCAFLEEQGTAQECSARHHDYASSVGRGTVDNGLNRSRLNEGAVFHDAVVRKHIFRSQRRDVDAAGVSKPTADRCAVGPQVGSPASQGAPKSY